MNTLTNNINSNTIKDKIKIMKTIINSLVLTLMTAFIALPAAAEEIVTDDDRNFYRQLSPEASAVTVVTLEGLLEDAGVSQLYIKRVIVKTLQEDGLSPDSPRWSCCETCIEKEQPNDSVACQCCSGAGDDIIVATDDEICDWYGICD